MNLQSYDLGITHTQEKEAKPTRVQSLRAFGLPLSRALTGVDETQCPTSAGRGACCASGSQGF